MIRGIYTNSSAMQYLQEKMDIVANNLANSNTNGFKRNGLFINELMDAQQANIRNKINQPLPEGEIQSYTENTQGPLRETKNKLDFALNGDGFFSVQTPDGIQYTRDGQFTVSPEGLLVTPNGYQVIGQSGPIAIQGEKIEVADNGLIMVDGSVTNKFDVKTFDVKDALQQSNNLWKLREDGVQVEPSQASVKQGYIENSNVQIVKEMVDMIAVQRWYNVNERSIRTNDDALNKAVNQIAR